MPKATELTVDIKARFDVDRRTAETCLRLVELYINANDLQIMHTVCEDGQFALKFVRNSDGRNA